ncbi:hypothetical protein LV476_02125 [Guyparkeria hydrothermalis]|uniref:hypothetical protein n=1 Tax=Guyparkeria hydrothermalis TaxID=923 RepID=UPI002021E648|nr:hypothetical protein [Guyparkeria hydrothermalis]MCL7743749.1 hypothetical protein [Guyparkeria hydrothermalis]
MKRSIFPLAGTLLLASGLVVPLSASAQQMGDEMRVYGSELMTQQEQLEYRDRLREAQTLEERERIRQEHHDRMLDRARERGVDLPEAPPRGGAGMGSGGGIPGAGYDGRERMEQQQMERRERTQEQMEHRDRMRDSNGDYRRSPGMGGGRN